MKKSSKLILLGTASLLLMGCSGKDNLACLNQDRQVVDSKYCRDEEDKQRQNPRYYGGSSFIWLNTGGGRSVYPVGSFVPSSVGRPTYGIGSVPSSVASRSSSFSSVSRGGFGATGHGIGSAGA